MNPDVLYHFTNEKLRDGKPIPPIGKVDRNDRGTRTLRTRIPRLPYALRCLTICAR